LLHFSHIDKNSERYCYTLTKDDSINEILEWALQYKILSYFNSNDYYKQAESKYFYNKYDFLLAFKTSYNTNNTVHNMNQLNEFINNKTDWLIGYLGYDLKNDLHNLESKNLDYIHFDKLFFFIPDIVIYKENDVIIIESIKEINIKDFTKAIKEHSIKTVYKQSRINTKSRFSKKEYIETVNKIKDEIQFGNVYELNFCQEFYSSECKINPWDTYKNLVRISPTPFSVYFRQNDKYIISSSPERYITRQAEKIISQPIKGTIRKSNNKDEDKHLVLELRSSVKEQSENIMIVDLVRNDLSRTASQASVKVEELCGIYSFKQLHQMISTVSSELRENKNNVDVIKSSFPMGSMTGAPKIKAMELIEKFEKTKRGLYSGSVGYFSPNGDFDFNVVIRSFLYNESNKYLSYTVGSAITIKSNAESEYEECLLKAKAIRECLQ